MTAGYIPICNNSKNNNKQRKGIEDYIYNSLYSLVYSVQQIQLTP